MKIEVTQEDIDNGIQMNCYYCPIARSIQRQTDLYVAVRANYAVIGDDIAYFPREAEQFIADFDAGEPVHPFSFEI
jgi:hypothetical protein